MSRKIFHFLILIVIVFSIVGCKKNKRHEHTIVTIDEVVATCTNTGLTEGKKCSTCGEIIEEQQIINAKGHNEVFDEETNSTCNKPGLTSGSHCSICNTIIVKQEEKELLDHNYGDWKLSVAPTQTTAGSKIRTCLFCSTEEKVEITYSEVEEYINECISEINVPTETTTNIELPKTHNNVSIKWATSNEYILSSSGEIISRGISNKKVYLIATYKYFGVSIEQRYDITILGYTNQEKVNFAMEEVIIPDIISGNVEFDTTLSYGVKATYISSNTEILSNDGQISPQDEDVTITITILFTLGEVSMEKSFDILVKKYEPLNKLHQITEYAKDYDLSNYNNFVIKDGKLELADGIVEATYTSEPIETLGFKSLVASWAAISSENATCELKVSCLVNNQWSDFITYGKWGLGLKNESYDQVKNLIKLVTDEVMILNNKQATAFKYTITLSRTDETFESPKLSLVSFALEIPGHTHFIDVDSLPKSVNHDVPKLCQLVVPGIGNSICSATSTTMLLKYYGFNFSDKDSEFEHRYIASIVKDYGNNIYGNWVYNTVTMGGYGLNAYVARMYSIEELLYHLAYVGPVSLSMKGQMTSNLKDYYTAGHLIVVTGYKYVDGKLIILSNDPNVPDVACEYTEEVIKNTWRNIAYVIEK